ncbi:hypothetical protein MMPV_002504 [Pyropia vietnamensis]
MSACMAACSSLRLQPVATAAVAVAAAATRHARGVPLVRGSASAAAGGGSSAAPLVPHFVSGAVRVPTLPPSASWTPVTDPATGAVIGRVPPEAAAKDVAAAVDAAAAAFPAWQDTPLAHRSRVVARWAAAVSVAAPDLAADVVRETGKTLADAEGDVTRGLEVLEYAAAAPALLTGTTFPGSRRGGAVDMSQRLLPLGTVLGITPFNFPVMIPLWVAPLALVAGNTVLLKPPPATPSAAVRLAALATEAGVPPGAIGVVQGGAATAASLIAAPPVRAVSFVGSTPAGRAVYAAAAAAGVRAQANLGAKNHGVVAPDADVDAAAAALTGAAFGASGQRCMALSVAVVVGGPQRVAAVVDAVVARTAALRLGAGNSGGEVGPLISADAVARVRTLVAGAAAEGATVVLDGTVVDAAAEGVHPGGFWLRPSIVTDVTPGMAIYEQEVFGPVLCFVAVPTMDAAAELVRASPYGNGTAVFTTSAAVARRYAAACGVGQVGVNVPIPVPAPALGFTGGGGSALGDLPFYGRTGLQFYTRPQTVVERWPEQGSGGAGRGEVTTSMTPASGVAARSGG